MLDIFIIPFYHSVVNNFNKTFLHFAIYLYILHIQQAITKNTMTSSAAKTDSVMVFFYFTFDQSFQEKNSSG